MNNLNVETFLFGDKNWSSVYVGVEEGRECLKKQPTLFVCLIYSPTEFILEWCLQLQCRFHSVFYTHKKKTFCKRGFADLVYLKTKTVTCLYGFILPSLLLTRCCCCMCVSMAIAGGEGGG